MDFIIDIDTYIFLAINGFNAEFADPFMKAFSGKQPWIVMYVAIAATLCWFYGWRRALILIAAVGLAVGASDFVCASVIRPFVQRLRPSNLENEISVLVHIVDGYRSGTYGFPSCHATNTVALATFTALLIPRRSYMIFISLWAFMQCYSRAYLGVHYPGDLAVGAIIGAAISYGIYRLVTRYVDINEYNTKAKATPMIVIGIAIVVFIAIKSVVI